MATLGLAMSILDRPKEPITREPAFFSLQIAEARRFFDSSHVSGPLRVVGGGVERCSAAYRVSRRDFPYVGVEFVAGGGGSLTLGNEQFPLVPGMLFAYDKKVPHSISSDAQNPLVKYFVDVTGARVRPLLKEAGLQPGRVSYSLSPQSILPIFDELIRSGIEQTGPRSQRCRSALFEALVCRIGDTRVDAPGRSAPAGAFDAYLRCRREIDRSAVRLRSLRDLAERCGVSEAYMCRLFVRFGAGETPYRLLKRLKIEYAVRRLSTEPGLLVKRVAHEAGFGDAFTFSKAFRAVLGRTPSQCRATGDKATA
jgi:AraC-like DNA-binding protein